MFAYWVLSFWLLLFFNAFMRTADCISYCHLQENTNVFFQIFGYYNYESNQWFHILSGTKLYLCILNHMLMLEHALTEYYVSICSVNLLYSNFSLPEINAEI